MVIHDFHIVRMTFSPAKADTPLIVDADAVLSAPFAEQGFQAMGWGNSQVLQGNRRIDALKTHPGSAVNVLRDAVGCLSARQLSGFFVPVALDHGGIVTRNVIIVKRYQSARRFP
jgi:hypothetical protein